MDVLGRKTCDTARTVKSRGRDSPMLESNLSRCDFGLAAETQRSTGDGG
jgi:hypothetical protein